LPAAHRALSFPGRLMPIVKNSITRIAGGAYRAFDMR